MMVTMTMMEAMMRLMMQMVKARMIVIMMFPTMTMMMFR